MTASRARLAVMTVCTLIITSGAWVGRISSDTLVIVLLGLTAMGTAAYMANYFSFAQDVDRRHTGLVVGILGGLGNVVGAIVGSVALVGLPEVFRIAAEYRILIYGIVLLLLVRFRPQGLLGTI